jgi:histidyl-tRNA synthetase
MGWNLAGACEVYPEKAKLDKQFKYANNKNISYVAIIGENELANSTVIVKNMSAGNQETMLINELAGYFKN